MAKKQIELTLANFRAVSLDEGASFNEMQCCAFVEFSGLRSVKTVEDAVALRRVASGDFDLEAANAFSEENIFFYDADGNNDENDFGSKGSVLVTTIPSQSGKYPLLKGAGFVKIAETPGNGNNTVSLWIARTLPRGKVEKREFTETVTIDAPAATRAAARR